MAKKKVIKGTLSLYVATGETQRLQFIGNDSMDDKGRVTNYEEVYDIDAFTGDQVRLTGPEFMDMMFFRLSEAHFWFLFFLTSTWKTGSLPAEFIAGPKHKSWAQHTTKTKTK